MEEKLVFFNDYSIHERITNINSSIRIDMGLDGDDAYYFLKDFEKEFGVSILSRLEFVKYFYTEYELCNNKSFRKIEDELSILALLNFLE